MQADAYSGDPLRYAGGVHSIVVMLREQQHIASDFLCISVTRFDLVEGFDCLSFCSIPIEQCSKACWLVITGACPTLYYIILFFLYIHDII